MEFDERKILKDSGKISHELAKSFAESEFEKYRVFQDRVFESDFDQEVKKLEKQLRKRIPVIPVRKKTNKKNKKRGLYRIQKRAG